jgi:hypothetical protein
MSKPAFRLLSPQRRIAVSRRLLLWVLLSALALGAVPAAFAGGLDSNSLPVAAARAAAPGQMVKAPDLASPAELVRLAPDLIPTLLALHTGERVRVADWPVAAGVRRDVLLTRHEIYAPGARIVEVSDSGVREVPRSTLVFFWGTEADDPTSGVFVAIDPATTTVESQTQQGGVQHQMRPLEPGKPGLHLVATAEAFLVGQGAGKKPQWRCGQEGLVPLPPEAAPGGSAPSSTAPSASSESSASDPSASLSAATFAAGAALGQGAVTDAGSAFTTATVAIDTDHQFMANKFSNNTTNATNYIASLFAMINVMYERDLQVQLLVGNTTLRTSAAADPYVVNDGGNADGTELSEFSTYWGTNYGAVTRTVATMLSGKSASSNESSGIAWVSGLCSHSFGYNFVEVFLIDYLAGDSLVVGHEIGHNFGSVHTHCYTPPIDMCYNAEPGCYSGPTSCPSPTTINGVNPVYGTIMGYCHLLGGCQTQQVFHPRTVAVIDPNITAATGVCMTAGGSAPAPTVTAVSPNHGSTLGGTTITITGTNFASGATVTVGGTAATNVTVVNSTTITARTGAHATGTVAVAVTVGTSTGTLGASYFYAPPPSATHFFTVAPCRVIDTRNAAGPLGGPALSAGQQRSFKITGQCGLPTGAIAVSVNVTAIAGGTSGFFSLYPGNAFYLGTSTLSFGAGQVLASNTILYLATDGTGTFVVDNGASGNANFVLDVNGYFQ